MAIPSYSKAVCA